MAVDHKEFLKAAQRMKREPREIDRRNTASRAYYAVFHRCRSIAVRHGLASTNYVQHGQLIDAIKRSHASEDITIVKALRRAQWLRTKADYHINQDFAESEATDSLEYATRIFELANESDRQWQAKQASTATEG